MQLKSIESSRKRSNEQMQRKSALPSGYRMLTSDTSKSINSMIFSGKKLTWLQVLALLATKCSNKLVKEKNK